MLKTYLKIATRNLWKHRLFSFINIFGLSLSLAVCMVVMMHVKDELGYDQFHPYPEKTYRILTNVVQKRNNENYLLASTPLPLHTELKAHQSILQDVVQVYPSLRGKASSGPKEFIIKGAYTDPAFFRVFGFRLHEGNSSTALEQANSIVLNYELAIRFFGNESALGKTLDLGKFGIFNITGVLKRDQGKSHLDYEAYASVHSIGQNKNTPGTENILNDWNTLNQAYTYVLLKNNIARSALDGSLDQVSKIPALQSEDGKISFESQAISSISPGTDRITNEPGKATVWAKLLTVVGIGLIILIAACFNYTNLTIARALNRAKEVGIRKVNGASRLQIFLQYMVESILQAMIALGFASLILKQMQPSSNVEWPMMLSFILFAIITGAAAGGFPAWILSAFKPVTTLKNLAAIKLSGRHSLQKVLTVFQFALSLVTIIFLSAYYRQFTFLERIDTGFESENILTVEVSSSDDVFPIEASRIAGVKNIFKTSEHFGIRGDGSIKVFKSNPSTDQGLSIDYYFADHQAIPSYQLKLLAGANFPSNESLAGDQIILNEKAAHLLGFDNYNAAIGERLWFNDSMSVSIAGIIQDFYHLGAARYISAMMLRNQPGSYRYLNLVVDGPNQIKVHQDLLQVWNRIHPSTPASFEWLDKKIAAREDQTDAFETLGFLAFITISIACLGLLGLVVYSVETRQKEISIRKVIGATTAQLMQLLSKSFLRLLILAGIIAIPIGYVISFFFLQNFANRVSFGLGTLLSSFFLLLIIGMITILSQTYKTASQNPVKNLRNE